MSLSLKRRTRDGVVCKTVAHCLLNSTTASWEGDLLTFSGTTNRVPPDDKARNI